MPSYTQAELNTSVTARTKGTFTAANFLTFANDAVREVISEIDLRSMKRKEALVPNLFDEVYQYTCPSTLKADRIIDVKPQIDRAGRGDYWELVTEEEFDRLKDEYRVDKFGDPLDLGKGEAYTGSNFIAISRDDLTNKLLLSKPVDDDEVSIDALDALGDWVLYGDGTNLTADSDNYVKGSGSINWDISAAGGTTAGIQNTSLDTFDVSSYIGTGSVFVWVYITSATNLTNFKLLIGQDLTTNYYTITITTNNEGASFYAGWNLLRFDFVNKSETGTVDQDGCDSVALYMTKDAAKVSETDYRFDNLVLKMGPYYDVIYYSRYAWQSSTGTFLEDATATTDLLNLETDEFNLIVLKTLQFAEEHLKHSKDADRWERRYKEAKAEYIDRNPSEALQLQQTYHHISPERW